MATHIGLPRAFLPGHCPLAAPHLITAFYPTFPTKISKHGVCVQQEAFTCGPAAAVTAARLHGHNLSVQQIAKAARSNPWFGSSAGDLARAIRQHGLDARIQSWPSLDHLEADDVGALLILKFSTRNDHWVCWLGYNEHGKHRIADPSQGLQIWCSETLKRRWRGRGISIRQ
ncbi:MAG: hypothetical protein EA402_05510 [Planctomycetota bacterium]|nr:MAG: hypothetical protein EA402_05510 [Planctomycetota bacterium]